ncbi:hypothetical protein FGM00_04675 [Aggregatimonas sangjinii]|uniref:Lipoprotein n=1 Tax=Aggregatimonas sangjinii TaxID=2583587 RepID=A0A5B7SLW1_9FLAO|nr:DUF6503 family protein [Aggregatimonas sangjinii]QCW99436.1 hypothetical protein FGM00_04675 [Aggregatimonas sangjinii]
MNKSVKILSLVISAVLLGSCKAVDLRTDALKTNNITNAEQKGKDLLIKAKNAMGYDKLSETKVYEANTKFNWNGTWLLMPMNAFPGNNNKELQLRLVTNSFDGQVEYKEGRKEGVIQGVQSWEGYKKEVGSGFLKRHEHDRYIWGLATYHYLLEAPMHLPDAEIIRYAGTKEIDGKSYETVYVTWGTEEPNKQYDRFLVYINPSTKHIDLLEVTINDFFISMPKGLQHATARYERKKTSIGAYLPSNVQIQLKGPKKLDNKVYSFALSNYQFDSFDRELLYPLEEVEQIGFNKIKE